LTIILGSVKLNPPVTNEIAELQKGASKILNLEVPPGFIRIRRKALDARMRHNIHFTYSLEVNLGDPELEENMALKAGVEMLKAPAIPSPRKGAKKLDSPPVVVGTGPAGIFAALLLARNGYNPVILERGGDVGRRTKKVHKFLSAGMLDPDNNYLFGEGGAGAYSDGKLTSRTKSPWRQWVLDTFVKFGAPEDVGYLTRPHIGSDRLAAVIKAFRKEISALGGTFHFDTTVSGTVMKNGNLAELKLENGDSIQAQTAILAPGSSNRPFFRQLLESGVALEAKPFQMGLRLEHTQEFIDRWKFGGIRKKLRLPPAEYFLTIPSKPERIHSFCMCPGGAILPTVEREGIICTNGMSRYERDGRFASSAFVVTVRPGQFGSGPLAGMDFQLEIEGAAWKAAGGAFRAPCQGAGDFLAGRPSPKPPECSYPFELAPTNLRKLMPPFYAQSLRSALGIMNKRIKGFASNSATLVWPETRASCPVRILRDPVSGQSVSTPALFPVGEGAGYAGGITSSAIDGLQAASKLIEIFSPSE